MKIIKHLCDICKKEISSFYCLKIKSDDDFGKGARVSCEILTIELCKKHYEIIEKFIKELK